MKIVLYCAVIVGSVIGAMAVWVAWEHNTQSELVETSSGMVDWSYLGLIFGSWFLVTGAVFLALGAGGIAISRLFRRSIKTHNQ